MAASQTVNFSSSVLRILITSSILLPSMKTLVSSANRIERKKCIERENREKKTKKNTQNLSDPLGRDLINANQEN